MFIDKIHGMKMDDVIKKHGYSRRCAYNHVQNGRKKFIKYLEERDVLL